MKVAPLALLFGLVIADIDTQCQLCFTAQPFANYCMYGLDSVRGKCCIPGSGDSCLLTQFYCTNTVTTSFTYSKYAYCSFDSSKCGGTSRNLFAINTPQTVSTSLLFDVFDVCPFYVTSSTDLPFNTNVKVTVNTAVNAYVYLLTGPSFDGLTSQTQLSSGQSKTFSSKEVGIIIAVASTTAPFVSFSYENV